MIKKMRLTKVQFILIVMLAVVLLSCLSIDSISAYAADDDTSSEDLTTSVQDILDALDLSDLEQFLVDLDDSALSVFGSSSAIEKITMIISGDIDLDYGGLFSYVLYVIGIDFLQFLPMMIAILVICISMNVVSSLRAKTGSSSVESIVSFASIALIAIILSAQLLSILSSCSDLVESLQSQIQVIFPILLTLMSATGSVSSVAVYQPSVAILGFGIMEIILSVIFPFFILSAAFTIVGNLSDGVKLKKMSEFFMRACKWLLGTAFFLFIAFLSVQGITASIFDSVSVRTAKFAISNYVPVIGSYLSEGFNLIMAGSVLVKNAVGLTSVVILILSVLPTVASVIIFNLSLHLTSAIVEPLGNSKVTAILSSLAKNMSTLVAILLGAIFLYFIFLLLIICTGNLSL